MGQMKEKDLNLGPWISILNAIPETIWNRKIATYTYGVFLVSLNFYHIHNGMGGHIF